MIYLNLIDVKCDCEEYFDPLNDEFDPALVQMVKHLIERNAEKPIVIEEGLYHNGITYKQFTTVGKYK